MKAQTKSMIGALAAFLFFSSPEIASADRAYYLVGTRHAYQITTWPDANADDREDIELQYGDAVAAAQAEFDRSRHDSDAEATLNDEITQAADARDTSLSEKYTNCDAMQDAHPEFTLDVDGPYQVIGVDADDTGEFADFIVFSPLPGFALSASPYGWTIGRTYDADSFKGEYAGWHERYWATHRKGGMVGMRSRRGIVHVSSPVHGIRHDHVSREPKRDRHDVKPKHEDRHIVKPKHGKPEENEQTEVKPNADPVKPEPKVDEEKITPAPEKKPNVGPKIVTTKPTVKPRITTPRKFTLPTSIIKRKPGKG